MFPVRFPNIVTLQAFTSKDQMMEPAMHQTFLFHIFVSIYPSFGACPLSPCTHFVSFSCGLWSIKLSRSIRLRRFIARRLASRFDRTRRLGRGLPGPFWKRWSGLWTTAGRLRRSRASPGLGLFHRPGFGADCFE